MFHRGGGTILEVSSNRRAQARQLNPNLMRPPRLGLNLHQRSLIDHFEHAITKNTSFSMAVFLPADITDVLLSVFFNIMYQLPFQLISNSFHDRHVFFRYFVLLKQSIGARK